MRRFAISIPSCIAEGFGRKNKKDKNHFNLMGFGSSMELETQIIISKNLNYISGKDSHKADEILNEVIRMLNKMTSESRN